MTSRKKTPVSLEQSSLAHAIEWLRYQDSAQAALDRVIDRHRRIRCTIAVGHLPTCSLTKCDPRCKKAQGGAR